MNQAHIVGEIRIKDPGKWEEYRSRVPATLAPWGAEVLFRGKLAAVYGGEIPHTDIVAIRFRSLEEANAWFASPAYQALIPLREEAAEVTLCCYEG